MNDTARRLRNQQRLQELFPTVAARVAAVIHDLEDEGWRPRIQDAWRSPAAQQAAFEAGHSKLRYGFHNVTGADGRPEALAVDLLDDDAPLNPAKPFLLRLAAAADQAGLATGIRWGLPAPLARAIDAAISLRDWQAAVKIGWDPTHVQATGVTVAQARAGARPA
ncbi:MAG: hypothetical protein RJA10_348 [Pseudomonadota bacterium]|jgi:hypothetical protein